MTTIPFRYYGQDPDNWREGAAGSHAVEIQFQAALTAAQRHAFAVLGARFFQRGASALSGPVSWSDRFALVPFGERFGSARDAFAHVDAFLAIAHREIAPIIDVVHWSALEASSSWHRASVEARAQPDPGPAYLDDVDRRVITFARAVDPSLPPAGQDDAFEHARDQEAARLRDQRLARALAKDSTLALEPLPPGDDPGGQVHPFSPAVTARFRVPATPVRRAPGPRVELPPGDHLLWRGGARPVAAIYEAGKPGASGVAYLDGDQRRELLAPEPLDGIVLRRDGARALAWGAEGPHVEVDGRFVRQHALYELDFEAGTVTERMRGTDISAAYLEPHLWLVRVKDRGLEVFDASERPPRSVASAALKSWGPPHVVCGGEVVLASGSSNLAVFAWIGGRLRPLGALPKGVRVQFWNELPDGRVVLWTVQEPHRFLVMSNLDDRLEHVRRQAARAPEPRKRAT